MKIRTEVSYRVFTASHFHRSLIFEGKDLAYPSDAPNMTPL